MKRTLVAAILSLWLASLPVAIAQTYRIDWYSIDAGGGVSSGGTYTLESTIGQPDADPVTLVGGTYSLQGGFWPGIATSATAETPILVLQIVGGSALISWSPATAGFRLEQTDTLESPSGWQLSPAGNPVSVGIEGTARFYRLRKP